MFKRKQKFHKPAEIERPEDSYQLRDLSIALMDILLGEKHLDKVLEKTFAQRKTWKPKDKSSFHHDLYYSLFHFYALSGKAGTGKSQIHKIAELVYKGGTVPKIEEDPEIRYSVPGWIWNILSAEYGEKAGEIMEQLNKKASTFVRFNPLKCDAPVFQEYIKNASFAPIPAENTPDAYLIKEPAGFFRSEAFRLGWLEVQDLHSQQIILELPIKPGIKIADTCAGAGGKSLQMAALMRNKGKIIACDVKEYKLAELQRRARRNGVDCIETRLLENQKVLKRMESQFDLVLIDAPCSGSGVWRRNPDGKYHFKPEWLEELKQTQKEILDQHSRLCKENGTLAYITCSVFKSEGEEQTKHFLEQHPEFELVKEKRWWLGPQSGDAFYLAVFRRK